MMPGDEERPVLGPDPARSALDPRLLTGQAQEARLGAAIDVDARVLGVVQDVQDTGMAQRSPNQLTVAGTTPESGGALEMMVGEVLDDRQGGSRLLEQVEDQPDRLLDLFVGVEDDPALGIVDQPRGQPEPELALGGLLELATQEAGTKQVEFGLAHRPQESQEEAVGVLSGVIDPILVDDQGVGEGTDLDETIPIAARPRQARGFQAQDGPGPAQADLGDEVLKAVATGRGRPRVPLVLIDDLDPLRGPSQLAGTAGQVILPGAAGGVFAHLNRGGLADVDLGQTVEVIRPDLRGKGRDHHRQTSGEWGPTLGSRDGTRAAPGTG